MSIIQTKRIPETRKNQPWRIGKKKKSMYKHLVDNGKTYKEAALIVNELYGDRRDFY